MAYLICIVGSGAVGFLLGYLYCWSKRDLFALLIWLGAGASAAGGPLEAVQAATADAKRLPPGIAYGTRYLDLGNLTPPERAELVASVSFWANATSVEAEIVRPRRVGPELIALYLPDYGAGKLEVWERFAESDPYYHERLQAVAGGNVLSFHRAGKTWSPGMYSVKAAVATTFVVPTRSMNQTELAILTNSACPILRADWWQSQVAVQVDRKVGYYDWLGVGRKRGDFERVVGLDRVAAQRVRKEVAAIVSESVVALHNRHVYRYGTLTGAYWETRDAKANDGERNALRLLNGDYKHDAEEIIASLPNGLHAYYLSDAVGVRVDNAPDFIASDGTSSSSDRRVHVGISCVRCHVEGIRPIDCWFRRAYAAPDNLAVLDPARAVRLRQLYASDLDRIIRRDQADYAEAVKSANGLSVGDNAKVVAAVWSRYLDQPVDPEMASRELGVAPERLVAVIRMQQQPDPVLFALGKQKSLPVLREHWEEIYQVAWKMIVEAQ